MIIGTRHISAVSTFSSQEIVLSSLSASLSLPVRFLSLGLIHKFTVFLCIGCRGVYAQDKR
jgi:hypothetical protein